MSKTTMMFWCSFFYKAFSKVMKFSMNICYSKPQKQIPVCNLPSTFLI